MTRPAVDAGETTPWHRPGRWHVSPWNFAEEVQSRWDLPSRRRVFVVDSTLRSLITSQPGSTMTVGAALKIAEGLDAAGVSEVHFNITYAGVVSDVAFESCRQISTGGFRLKTCSGCSISPEGWKGALDRAVEAGTHFLEVSYGAIHHPGFTGTPWALEVMKEAVIYAGSTGHPASIAFNVKPDTNLDFFDTFFESMRPYGPRIVRLYDPYVCLSPEAMRWTVRRVRRTLGDNVPIVIHTHNTFGLGVMTTIAGVQAGARGIDVAVNSVGTHSGHTSLEETVVALEVLYGVRTGMALDRLTDLSRTVEEHAGPLHPNKPITGRHPFLCELPPWVIDVLQARRTGGDYPDEPIAAALVGQHERIVFGKNTATPEVVRVKMEEMGIDPTPGMAERAAAALRARVQALDRYPSFLEEAEADEIIRGAIGGAA